jgi:hypothetical protein
MLLVLITVKSLQYFLIPLLGILGILLGRQISQWPTSHPRWVFVATMALLFVIVKLAYLIGGDIGARFTYALAMGYLAFAIKLLK